jgi:hypothetical protein
MRRSAGSAFPSADAVGAAAPGGVTGPSTDGRSRRTSGVGDRYKWVALSNTTLGSLMAMIDISIMLIALPDIFRGIHINPLRTYSGHLSAPSATWEFAARIVGNSDRRSLSVL